MNGHLEDMDIGGQKGNVRLQDGLSDGDNNLFDRSYMNGHSTESAAEESSSTNNSHQDQQPETAVSVDSTITDSRLGSNFTAAGAVQMDESMPQQPLFSVPSTGLYIKKTKIVKTYQRITVSEQYYENGTLAFAARPTVQDREMDSKQDVQILPCEADQFQDAKAESVVVEEVAAGAHGANGTKPVIQEPSEADDISFAGSEVRSSKKTKSKRNMSLLSEDEESSSKEELSSSAKKTRQSTARGRKPIANTNAEVHFPSIGAHVLAGYNDNKYYSAKITAKAGRANTFEVRYMDTKEDSTVHESKLLDPAVWLKEDQAVLVKVNRETATGDYEAGVILEVLRDDDKLPRYKVRLEADCSDKTVEAADIALDDDEVLKHKFDKTSATSTTAKKERSTPSKSKAKSVSLEPSRTFSIGEMVYAQWKNSSRYYPGKISETTDEETSKYKVKYLDGDEEAVAPNEIILADDLVKPGMDAEVERTGHPFSKVKVREVKGLGEDIEATVEHNDTRQEVVHLTELTFSSKDARRVLSVKPLPANPAAPPLLSRRSDLRASTRTAPSPAKKPELKSTPKSPKVKKMPSVLQEVEPVSGPSGEHEVDMDQVFRIGKEQYYKGEQVFAQWDTDRRWYAATIGGVRAGKYRIDWCENDQVNYVTPEEVVRARDVLVKGTKVNVIAEGKNYYDEMVFETFSEDGNHLCAGKRGVIVPRKFNTMMIQKAEMENLKARLGSAASGSSQKSSTSDKEKSTPSASGRKRQLSPTTEPSPSARNGVKQAKKATLEPAEVADPTPLKDCAFIVTSGAEKDPSFDREYLIGQIERMGGGVLSAFEDLASSGGKRFLVSPNACRTAKYLQCLAANIPCISHKYIIDLAASGKRDKVGFEAYRLPAGKSSNANGNNQPVKWKPRKALLDNLRVGLVGGSGFQNTWMPAFKAGKALPTLLEEKDINRNAIPALDVIVVEDAASAKLIALARHKNIPMVTVEWIIQTLIHGEKQDYEVWPFQDSNVAE
ncbi:hypothetical protein RvY_12873 [Ramazzottius varieornatus]|uniref:BRCT domain-containing protein n=1 Tax=Ramazzottius varieornatus TaxID=947166 RepID=A0A1D1VTJ9_RAMVA|nr:hypothetical protein RvY_12873 [Ramazzottius varieornatus]